MKNAWHVSPIMLMTVPLDVFVWTSGKGHEGQSEIMSMTEQPIRSGWRIIVAFSYPGNNY